MKIQKKDSKRIRDSEEINTELMNVINECLKDDIDITARAVVRRMNLISQVTSITRNQSRTDLIKKAKEKQKNTRMIAAKIFNNTKKSDKEKILALEQKLIESLLREKNLQSAIYALIKASAMNGIDWIELFKKYKLEMPDSKES